MEFIACVAGFLLELLFYAVIDAFVSAPRWLHPGNWGLAHACYGLSLTAGVFLLVGAAYPAPVPAIFSLPVTLHAFALLLAGGACPSLRRPAASRTRLWAALAVLAVAGALALLRIAIMRQM